MNQIRIEFQNIISEKNERIAHLVEENEKLQKQLAQLQNNYENYKIQSEITLEFTLDEYRKLERTLDRKLDEVEEEHKKKLDELAEKLEQATMGCQDAEAQRVILAEMLYIDQSFPKY